MKKYLSINSAVKSTTAVLALMLSLMAAPFTALAQDAAAGKIAVVDVRAAILQTEKAKAQLADLKKQDDFKNNLDTIKTLEAELKKMVEAYQKDRAVMSAAKREDEEKRIVDKQKDLNYIAGKLQQAQKEWMERATDEQAQNLQRVLQNLVDEQGIGMLIRADTGVVLHADASYDISAQVTERLNQIK